MKKITDISVIKNDSRISGQNEEILLKAFTLVSRCPTKFYLYEERNEYELAYYLSVADDAEANKWLTIHDVRNNPNTIKFDLEFHRYVNEQLKLLSTNSKWDVRFLNLAKTVASYSKDPSTKVGAVVVDDDDNVRTIGYNGFPRGVKDKEERLNNRDIKYPMTVHAELNAIATCARVGTPTKGATMVCTHVPCATCAGAIIQAGFKEVIVIEPDAEFTARWGDTQNHAFTMFGESGVNLIIIPENELNVDKSEVQSEGCGPVLC